MLNIFKPMACLPMLLLSLILVSAGVTGCSSSTLTNRDISGPIWQISQVNYSPERHGDIPDSLKGSMSMVFGPQTVRGFLGCMVLTGNVSWNKETSDNAIGGMTITDTQLTLNESQVPECQAGTQNTAEMIMEILTGPLRVIQLNEHEILLQRTDQKTTGASTPQSVRFMYGGS